MENIFKISISILFTFISICTWGTVSNEKTIKPNIILIFTDDQGYGDLGCFGSKTIKTPRIDQMAAEGVIMRDFYVAAPVCTPSRAALMTGSYPSRVNMAEGSTFGVLLAADTKGLNPEEITIAEVLQSAGYKTGMFGKWHLGDQPEFLPTRQGFDEFFGLPYSHDIHPFHPMQEHYGFPPLPLLEGENVIELDPDMNDLSQGFTLHDLILDTEQAINYPENYYFLPIPSSELETNPNLLQTNGWGDGGFDPLQ